MINILIRTSNRPTEFTRCINSIKAQTYKDVRAVVCTDDNRSLLYIDEYKHDFIHNVFTVTSTGIPFGWNLYCNELKERVNEGWFMYVDDDDWLIDKFCLSQIASHLSEDHATICQYKRGSISKPTMMKPGQIKPEQIIQGRIGGSSIILHHTHKNLANWDDQKAADFRFIRDVAEKLPMVFVPIVVVKTGNKGRHGQ